MNLKPDTLFVHFDESNRVAHVLHSGPRPEKFDEYRLVERRVKSWPKAPGFVLRDKACGLYLLTYGGPSGCISTVADPQNARRLRSTDEAFTLIDRLSKVSTYPTMDLEVCFDGLESAE